MKNRGGKLSVLGMVIVFLGILAFAHTAFYIHNYRTTGISGFLLADADNLEQSDSKSQRVSLILIIGELIVIATVIIAIRIIRKRNSKKEIRKIMAEKRNISAPSKTDIDLLYEILKHQKELGVGDIASAFSVSKDVAMEWCKILEENDMAEIQYASIGEPTIRLK